MEEVKQLKFLVDENRTGKTRDFGESQIATHVKIARY